jgi:hypothetical protein
VSALQHWATFDCGERSTRPFTTPGFTRVNERAGVGADRQCAGRVTGLGAGEGASRGGWSAIL